MTYDDVGKVLGQLTHQLFETLSKKFTFWLGILGSRAMAGRTIKKESFFEYNPVRKRNLSCEFASGFELLCFSMAGHRSAVEDS